MNKRSIRRRKNSVAFVALLTCGGVAWASCGGTEPLVVAAATAAAGTVITSITAAGASLIALDNVETQALLSSMKVLTQQINASGDKAGSAATQAQQALASVAKDLADKELVDQVMVDFTSQGFDPCVQLTNTQKFAQAEANARISVPNRVRTEIEAGGGRYAVQADVLKKREDLHQQLFCTQAEVDAGVCSSLGKIPGGDTNASLIFNTDTSQEMVSAKNAVINNIIGLPENPLPRTAVNTPEGSAFILEKKRKDALLGFASNSLKSIQADNETMNAALNERVGQYFGTTRAADWAKDQASQAQRGVIVDLVKIQGLQLKLQERKIRQNLRTEANLAALVALETQATQGEVTGRAEQIAIADQAKRRVTQ